MVIKKNWIEKGIRVEFFGSNPHSKGDDFSRSIRGDLANKEAINIISLQINKIIKDTVNKIKIIYTN